MVRLIGFLFLLFAGTVNAQLQPVGFEQLDEVQKKEERLVLVLLGTDWCKYCTAMKNAMLTDKYLSAAVSKKFYTIFLNAESKADIRFSGRIFKYQPTGPNTGIHELAQELGSVDGQLSFPTLCFLNNRNEVIYRHAGFVTPSSLIKLIPIIAGG